MSKTDNVIITEKKVRDKINNLKEHSSAGPDGIGPRILKAAVNELVRPLTFIFTESVRTAEIPKDWKKASHQ